MIVSIIERLGYLGVAVLMALENIFPPLPSEAIMGAGALAVMQDRMSFWPLLVFGTLGTLAGNYAWFWFGNRVGYERLGPFVDKWGRWLTLEWEDIERTVRFFQRHGQWAVFVLALGAAAILLPFLNLGVDPESPLHVPDHFIPLLGKYLCYAMVALAIDLIWGFTGILSLGHGTFFALGGYAIGMHLMRQIGQHLAPGGVHGGELGGHLVEGGGQGVELRAQLGGGHAHVVVAGSHLLGRGAELRCFLLSRVAGRCSLGLAVGADRGRQGGDIVLFSPFFN